MGYRYVPSWMEVVLTAAVALVGVLAFLALAQVLPVFPRPAAAGRASNHP